MRIIYISFYSLASTTRIDAVEHDRKEILIAMVVFLCFGSYILQPNLIFKIKISSNALTKLRSENLWKLRTEFDLMRLQFIICRKKELLSSLSSIKLVLAHNKCYQCKLVCTGTMNKWCKILTIKTLIEVNRT